MIVFRYLSREVLVTLSAVSAVLLVIIMSGRFIKYLAQAAQGVLDPGVLFMIMGFRIPGFLQLILPLGLFLGFLLAYGRLYLESEMTVLSATGMSQQRLMVYSLAPATLVALLVAWLSLGLAPQGVAQVARILNEQDALTEFDTLVPGRFQAMKGGGSRHLHRVRFPLTAARWEVSSFPRSACHARMAPIAASECWSRRRGISRSSQTAAVT